MNFEGVLAGRDYAVGCYESSRAGILIPADANKITISFARDAWDPLAGAGDLRDFHFTGHTDPMTGKDIPCGGLVTEVARGFLWVSYDLGNTWEMAGMIGMAGGAHIHRLGHLVTASTLATYLPITGQARLIRVTMDTMKGIRTQVDAEALVVVRNSKLEVGADKHHSVAVQAASAGAQATSATTVGTGNVTPAGTDRLVVISGGNSAGGGGRAATWTWDGGAVDGEPFDIQAQTFYAVSAAYKKNPATSAAAGTQTVGATQDELCAGAIAFDGVDQTAPVDTAVTANGGSGASSVNVATVTGDMVVDTVYVGNTTVTSNQSQTDRWEEENIGGFNAGAAGTKTGNGTITMGYTDVGAWLLGAFNINASGGAAATQQTLMLTGMGS